MTTEKDHKKRNEMILLFAVILLHIVFMYNVFYSAALSSAFHITDTLVRDRVVTFINCILMSLTLIPVYFICDELKVRKNYTWLVLVILFFWPDMTIAGTFIQENLYTLLVALTALLCIQSFKAEKLMLPALAGVSTYFTYNCKEVGLCIFLAYLSAEMIFPILEAGDTHESFTAQLKKIRYRNILVYIASFIVCYFVIKFVFLRDMANTYGDAGAVSWEMLKHRYTICYLLYSCVYYFASALIAFFILPVVIPAIRYGKLSMPQKKTYLLGLISLIYMIGIIGIMITIKESYGKDVPIVHMRYLFPLICIFLPEVFSVWSLEEEETDAVISKDYFAWAFASIFLFLVYKGVRIGSTTGALSLLYSYHISEQISNLIVDDPRFLSFYPGANIIVFLASAIMFLYLKLRKRGRKKVSVYLFSALALMVCLINFAIMMLPAMRWR